MQVWGATRHSRQFITRNAGGTKVEHMGGVECFFSEIGVFDIFGISGHRENCKFESNALNGFSLVVQSVISMGIL